MSIVAYGLGAALLLSAEVIVSKYLAKRGVDSYKIGGAYLLFEGLFGFLILVAMLFA